MINEWFDQVVLVNMNRSTDRLQKITKQLEREGISFTRFEAVDGSELAPETVSQLTTPFCTRFCSKSMIGCGASHIGVWKLAHSQGWNTVLVLEDDVYFADDYKETLEQAMQQMPDDWDMVYLGCDGVCSKQTRISGFQSENVFVPAFPLGFHAYALSRQGYTKLLNIASKVNYHIDFQVACHQRGLNMYAVHPTCVYQDADCESTNMQSNPFPRWIHKFLKGVKTSKNHTLSWYLNTTLVQLIGVPVTPMTFVLVCIGVLAGKYPVVRNLAVLVLVLELVHVVDKQFLVGTAWLLLGFALSIDTRTIPPKNKL